MTKGYRRYTYNNTKQNILERFSIGHIRTHGIKLELAYNEGSCGGISLKDTNAICIWKDSLY